MALGTGRATPRRHFEKRSPVPWSCWGAPPLTESKDEEGRPVWTFPALDRRAATDPSWAATLDTRRVPRKSDQKLTDWRRVAPIRPVVFEDAGRLNEDTVHLHLEQRVAQRLLARFRAQDSSTTISRGRASPRRGTPSRAWSCSVASRSTAAARNACTRSGSVTARWTEPALRRRPLRPYAREAEARILALLDASLGGGGPGPTRSCSAGCSRPRRATSRSCCLAWSREREEPARAAAEALRQRGEREARLLHETLERQRGRVMEEIERHRAEFEQIAMDFATTKEDGSSSKPTCATGNGASRNSTPTSNASPSESVASTTSQLTRVEPVGLVYLWPETN